MIKIRCHTLFNITHTGVSNRPHAPDVELTEWIKKRNTQCNFDTIMQIIAMRAQPDLLSMPVVVEGQFQHFGSVYDTGIKEWSFDFEVQHSGVFGSMDDPFSILYDDCNEVPMIPCHDTSIPNISMIVTSPEFRNIYFEVIDNEQY